MNAIAHTSELVTLPNGEEVQVSIQPEAWWTTQGGSGYVNPNLLAPDPEQPRKHINPVELANLYSSVESVGVRQSLVVTPRVLAPWVKLAPEYEDRPFVIVSGHRRWTGASSAELAAIPVNVKIYASELEHYEDASLLNFQHAELTALEKGYEFVRLRKMGRTVQELAQRFGISLPSLYLHMNLTRLHPDIQQLLAPELQQKRRLQVTIAGVLGNVKTPTLEELQDQYQEFRSQVPEKNIFPESIIATLDEDGRRFALQKLLLAVIQMRSLGTARAMEFVRSKALVLKAAQGGQGRRSTRNEPRKQREIFTNWNRDIVETVIQDWNPAQIRTIFGALSVDELTKVVARLTQAKGLVDVLLTRLTRLRDEKKC